MSQSWFKASNLGSRRKRRSLLTRVIFVVGVLFCCQVFRSFSPKLPYFNAGESSYFTRHLLSTNKLEKCDFETNYLRNQSDVNDATTPNSAYGWLVLHIICVMIIFVALAIICDDFFVPSLEAISEKLDLSEDVAGATFMAAGSSAPELFTSVAGVTSDSDVGVGTIVGSAVFNLLVIIALTAALTNETLKLDWRPIFRDSVCYALSITMFIIFAWDAKFEFYESIILLTLYFMYILLMKFNCRLMNFLAGWGKKVNRVSPEVQEIPTVETVVEFEQEKQESENRIEKECGPPQGKLPPLQPLKIVFEGDTKSDHSIHVGHGNLSHFSHSHKGDLSKSFTRRKSSLCPHEMVKVKSIAAGHISREMRRHSVAGGNETSDQLTDGNEDDDEPKFTIIPCLPAVSASVPELGEGGGVMAYIRLFVDWILFVVSFPFLCLFTWTIPNCSKAHTRKYFLVSFFASIIWIAILSFGMVTVVGRAGCILRIDKFTMGLVVVAIGTSIPDALSSIIVARDGFGDMAVSNAIGSNVFDIDLGIGLPFVIKSLIDKMKPIKLLSKKDQEIYDEGGMFIVPHAKFGFILLFILCVCIGVFSAVKFRLGRVVGTSFFLMYVIFVTYAYLQDLLCEHNC